MKFINGFITCIILFLISVFILQAYVVFKYWPEENIVDSMKQRSKIVQETEEEQLKKFFGDDYTLNRK